MCFPFEAYHITMKCVMSWLDTGTNELMVKTIMAKCPLKPVGVISFLTYLRMYLSLNGKYRRNSSNVFFSLIPQESEIAPVKVYRISTTDSYTLKITLISFITVICFSIFIVGCMIYLGKSCK